MSLLRPTNSFGRGSAPAPAPGGGGGEWTALTSSDLSIDKQGYTTFTLSASAQSGFEHRIDIGADTGRAANSADISQSGIVYFDTGINVNNLGNGDASTGVIQIMFEPYGVDSSSSYRTDVTYPQGVMLFSSLSTPPFSSGDKGYFGHGAFFVPSGSVNNAWYCFPRILRNTAATSIQASLWGFANPLKSLVHTVTFAQTVDTNTKALALTQSDFHGSIDDTTNGLDVALVGVAQVTDTVNSKTTSASDNIIIGLAFQVGVTNDGTTKGWDFNLKWRKILAE